MFTYIYTNIYIIYKFGILSVGVGCAAMRLFGHSIKNGTPVFILRGTGGCANKAALVLLCFDSF